METIKGPIGLSIPKQTLTKSEWVEMNPEAIMAWRNRLPMADTGATANQVYHVVSDSNKVKMPPSLRFQILDLLRTPVQFICQSLRKHYLNQSEDLNEKKLTIAKLAQTLQLEMSQGYKIIIEELQNAKNSEEYKTLVPNAIIQMLHYFNHVLLRTYHLYSLAPHGLWHETYLLWQFAERENFLTNQQVLDAFKHILIMSCTDPFQWRQSELDALFNATTVWCKEVGVQTASKDLKPDQFLILFEKDHPPFSSGQIPTEDFQLQSARIVDLTQLETHLKSLLTIVEPNELKARIEHSNDPEYAISLPVLQGLIQKWETVQKRTTERMTKTETTRVCVGLSSLHYYLNGERPFQPPQLEGGQAPSLNMQEGASAVPQVPTMTIESISGTNGEPKEESKKIPFQTHQVKEINESDTGVCLIWQDHPYPPIQAGELIGIEITDSNVQPAQPEQAGQKQWQIAMVRWLKHIVPNELRIGVQKLSDKGTASAAQILKEGKKSGYYLRAIIIDSGIITPTLPFKQGSQVLILKGEETTPQEIELLKLRLGTGSFKLFEYKSKEEVKSGDETGSSEGGNKEEQEDKSSINKLPSSGEDPFDSLWNNL